METPILLMVLIPGWIVAAVCTATVAERKGHNMIGWFLFGIAFGPLALMIACSMLRPRKLDE